jgi:hypothetical protein
MAQTAESPFVKVTNIVSLLEAGDTAGTENIVSPLEAGDTAGTKNIVSPLEAGDTAGTKRETERIPRL